MGRSHQKRSQHGCWKRFQVQHSTRTDRNVTELRVRVSKRLMCEFVPRRLVGDTVAWWLIAKSGDPPPSLSALMRFLWVTALPALTVCLLILLLRFGSRTTGFLLVAVVFFLTFDVLTTLLLNVRLVLVRFLGGHLASPSVSLTA